jgi:Flp pilus assembly protein TadG
MKLFNLHTLKEAFRKRFAEQTGQRGVAMIVVMLGFVTLFGAGSMAIDLSRQRTAGVELQNAADAAAVAAATALDGTETGITDAVNRALAVVNTYDFGSTITINRNDVRFARTLDGFDTAENFNETEAKVGFREASMGYVRVKIPNHYVNTLFLNTVVGRSQMAVTREHIAGRSLTGLIPPALDAPVGTLPTLQNTGPGFNTLCDWVPLAVLQDPVNNAPLNIPTGQNSGCTSGTNAYKFTPGCVYVIRAGSNGGTKNSGDSGGGNDNNTGMVSAGNFQCLAPIYPNGTADNGGSDLRINIARGVRMCIHPGDWIGTETGENSGTVKAGLNARFGDYSGGLSASTEPPDLNVMEGISFAEYRAAGPGSANFAAPQHGVGKPNRRVIMLPIINNNEFNNGRDQVRLYDMAPFFLRTKVGNGQGDITAEYIGSMYFNNTVKYDPSVPVPENGGRIRGLTRIVGYR